MAEGDYREAARTGGLGLTDQQAIIEHLRWWSQIYLWLAIGVPLLGGIAGGLLNLKRQHLEGQLRELSAHQTQTQLQALQTQSQELQQQVAGEREQRAIAEQALRNVEAQQRARTLTQEQGRMLIQRLHEGPKGIVQIKSPAGDAEADRFATQLYQVLRIAGWTLESLTQAQSVDQIPIGLQIPPKRAGLPPHGKALLLALREVGLEVPLSGFIDGGPADVVRLVVGAKPQPR